MTPSFSRHLLIVAGCHVFLLLCLMFGAWLGGFFHRSDKAKPITFEVDIRPLGKENKAGLPEPGQSARDPEDTPAPKASPKKADTPKKSSKKESKADKSDKSDKSNKSDKKSDKKSEKKAVKIGKLVTLPGRGSGSGPDYGQKPGQKGGTTTKPLSAAEIARLLALGGTPSDRTILPGQMDMYRLLVRNTLYDVWQPPGKDEAGSAVCVARVWFGDGGRILKWKIEKPSGIPALDSSVEQVLTIVREVRGLGSDFINQYRWKGFSIDFQVE